MSDTHGPSALPQLAVPPVVPVQGEDGGAPEPGRPRTVDDLVAKVRVDVEDQTSGQPEPPAELPGESVVPPGAQWGWNPSLPA
ncbi:MAG TPA: hypothetical protein VFS29_06470 [Motilibacteraceae bacterium]|nr:hypothetical protein [Motilibacteraceae bacterium]